MSPCWISTTLTCEHYHLNAHFSARYENNQRAVKRLTAQIFINVQTNATFSLHSVSAYITIATKAGMEANGSIECPSSRVVVNNTRKVELMYLSFSWSSL